MELCDEVMCQRGIRITTLTCSPVETPALLRSTAQRSAAQRSEAQRTSQHAGGIAPFEAGQRVVLVHLQDKHTSTEQRAEHQPASATGHEQHTQGNSNGGTRQAGSAFASRQRRRRQL